ncbi:MAG: hypothetical protein AB1744_04620 [Candidatus Zixiibacteriota bacterium]
MFRLRGTNGGAGLLRKIVKALPSLSFVKIVAILATVGFGFIVLHKAHCETDELSCPICHVTSSLAQPIVALSVVGLCTVFLFFLSRREYIPASTFPDRGREIRAPPLA